MLTLLFGDCDSADAAYTITKSVLHDSLDYTPYEGMGAKGKVTRTLLRGKTVFLYGQYDFRTGFPTMRGVGMFLPTGKPSLPGWSGEASWPDAGDIVEQRCAQTLGEAHDCGPVGGGRKRPIDS